MSQGLVGALTYFSNEELLAFFRILGVPASVPGSSELEDLLVRWVFS